MSSVAEPGDRWKQLAVLAAAVLLALVPWFSAASVAPLIAAEWEISRLETALLTVAVGCIGAGALADRFGRTTLTIAAMALSGSSAIAAGLLFGAPTTVVLVVVVIWGITVVADSAQFTAVSELAPVGTARSALALQTAAGFLLTGITIVVVGVLDPGDREAWTLAFGILALGPLVGIGAMLRLRRRPDAIRMAGGRR